MNQTASVTGDFLPAGKILTGKWTQQKIEVIDVLGIGANGQVYNVRTSDGYFAMKVATGAGEVAFEWHLLENLAKTTKHFPRPVFIDDSTENPPHYFYLMEKVEGKPIQKLFQSNTVQQITCLVENILLGLADLHRTKHAFCDVKPENILVTAMQTGTVRFVDVGGVTPFGRSVRQYTPFYDRAFWGLGSRISEARYDLAALALMLICLCNQPPTAVQQWTEKDRNHWLQKAVRRFRIPDYIPLLERALEGQLQSADEWIQALRAIPPAGPPSPAYAPHVNSGYSSSSGTIGKVYSALGTSGQSVGASVHSKTLSRPTSALTGQRIHRADWTEKLMWWMLGLAVVTTFTAWVSFFGWL